MEASAAAAAAAGRLALLGSAAPASCRALIPCLPAFVQHTRVASATPRGPPHHLPSLSFLSFHASRLPAAAKLFTASSSSSSSFNADGFLHVWVPPPGEGVGAPHKGAVLDDGGAAWTAVLLGWLGAEHKHLRRYAEIYQRRGMRAVSFVVPMGELILDMGKAVEGRIARLARELAAWVEGREVDGRERRLLFHTFSNTGWFTYGAILGNLQSKGDVIQKIKGCVIDSGADPEINPEVWAAGFCASILKKRSSLTNASVESIEGKAPDVANSRSITQQARTDFIEFILLSVLEKFFTVILGLPDVNERLKKILSILSNNQPHCPQLYLYSSADRVIPVRSVELFIQGQRSLGREVWAYDFVSSPHVDHLRTFPHTYSAKLDEFLRECSNATMKQM